MKKLLLLIATAIFTFNAQAQSQWVTNGPSGKQVTGFVQIGSNLFAGTEENGVYVSADSGSTWTPAGLSGYDVEAFIASGSTLFAETLSSSFTNLLYYSTNNGSTWIPTGVAVGSMVASGDSIFASINDSVYLSTNAGQSWVVISNGLTTGNSGYIEGLALKGNILIANTQIGVFISTNRGTSWKRANQGLGQDSTFITGIAFNGSNIFASSYDGVYLSTNNGSSWVTVNNGLTTLQINFLVNYGDHIFAATNSGLFHTINNGKNWLPINTSTLADSNIAALAIYNSIIYLGLDQGYGVWQESFASATGIPQIAVQQPDFKLYPNPAGNNFTIETTGLNNQLLQVYDITGKLVLSQNISNNKTSINSVNLSNGIYTVKLVSSNGSITEKLVIVK